MFIFETTQLLEQLEQVIIDSEKSECYQPDAINEIFRIMHTIKGSSAMMCFSGIATLSHTVEDLFYFLREEKPECMDYSRLTDIVLEGVDFIKSEMKKIENGDIPDKDVSYLVESIKLFLVPFKVSKHKSAAAATIERETEIEEMYPKRTMAANTDDYCSKNIFKAVLYYEEDCGMENIRAYASIHNLKEIADEVYHIPADISDNDSSAEIIRREGFQIWFKTNCSFEEIHSFFSQIIFLKDLELTELGDKEEFLQFTQGKQIISEASAASEIVHANVGLEDKSFEKDNQISSSHQSIISVSVAKLDMLMDLMGELVISEAMVTQNPDLKGLTLESFQKASSQHRKIINELQDIAMSIRMVPLSTTFLKMNRIVRDMSKKLSKEVKLEIIGEETEVDKNIIERISDPLMHLIRNSIDHGIEASDERKVKGKPETGTITLEAKNAGGDVLIIVKDDGRGLDKKSIFDKARENGLVNRPEGELLDKEIYSYIFLPGFSTKDRVTEFSGRGVGMDVVTKNIGAVGGTVSIDSIKGEGTVITLKIPLTLAIMNGMIIQIGKARYTIPIISIKESFKAKEGEVINDPDGNEMIMIRGECHPVLRLHQLYKVKDGIRNITDGIIVMVENEGKGLCILVDALIGEQQVVVKALPDYIRAIKKVRGLTGCTLLGDGSISLILDIAGLMEN